MAKQSLSQHKRIGVFRKMEKQENTLKELMSSFKQERVVERLINAENKVKTFEAIQRKHRTQLRQLKEGAVRKGHSICSEMITTENAVAIGTICLMAGIEDYELFQNHNQFYYVLQNVSGNEEGIATKMYRYFLSCKKGAAKKDVQDLVLKIY